MKWVGIVGLVATARSAAAEPCRSDAPYFETTLGLVGGIAGRDAGDFGFAVRYAFGYARRTCVSETEDTMRWHAGVLAEAWLGHAPFSGDPGAPAVWLSPGLEIDVTWPVTDEWRLGPRASVSWGGWASERFGSGYPYGRPFGGGVPPIVSLGVRVETGDSVLGLEMMRTASVQPDAPYPYNGTSTSVIATVGFKSRRAQLVLAAVGVAIGLVAGVVALGGQHD